MSDESSNDWVTLTSYHLASNVQMARLYLEEAGITCLVLDEHASTIRPSMTLMTGGMRLQVRRKDFAKAERILGHATNSDSRSQVACPKCGATKVYRRDLTPPLLYLTIPAFAFSIICFPIGILLILFYRAPLRCMECRHAWRIPVGVLSKRGARN